ncbi:MAG: hypothetical protein AB1546_13200 [bacterium]
MKNILCKKDYECVHVAYGSFDAGLICGLLDSAGIPNQKLIQSEAWEAVYMGDTARRYEIYVPKDRADEARQLIESEADSANG